MGLAYNCERKQGEGGSVLATMDEKADALGNGTASERDGGRERGDWRGRDAGDGRGAGASRTAGGEQDGGVDKPSEPSRTAKLADPGSSTPSSGTVPVPTLALAALGLFLFDTGYHFARPMLTDLSSALDVVQVAGQAGATLAFLLAALGRRGRRPSARDGVVKEAGVQDKPRAEADVATRRARAAFAAPLLAIVFSLLAQAVIVAAPAGTGLVGAYVGTGLSGLEFGTGYLAWAVCLMRTQHVGRTCMLLLAALAASRAADTLIRLTLPGDAWMPLGFGLIDTSLVLLALVWAAQRNAREPAPDQPAGRRAPDAEPVVVGLVGAALFSALFGLMTQMHNVSQGPTSIPDQLSCVITLLLFVPLAAYVGRSPRPLRLGSLFLAALPVMAGVLVVVALLDSSVLGMADALIKTQFNAYFAAVLVYLAQHRASGAALAAGMLFAVWGGVLAGTVAGFAVTSFVSLDGSVIAAVALVAVWLCTLASTFVASSSAHRAELAAPISHAESPQAQPEVRYIDRREEQLDRLIATCGLSARESQVVRLFSQGRSAARIAEELTLSENTVKTHLQNIYSKAGVHSKQELIDLLGKQ